MVNFSCEMEQNNVGKPQGLICIMKMISCKKPSSVSGTIESTFKDDLKLLQISLIIKVRRFAK